MDRHSQASAERIRRGARTQPATLMVFDVLQVDGDRTTGRALMERQATVAALVRRGPSLIFVESWPGTAGTAVAQAVAERDLEGIVGKRLDSTRWISAVLIGAR